VIRGGEAGRRGARWHNVTFTLDDFLALKGLKKMFCKHLFWHFSIANSLNFIHDFFNQTGFIPYSCYDGAELLADLRNLVVFDGIC